MTPLPANLAQNPRLSAWVAVDPDGVLTVRTGKVELGQGAVTALAAIAAAELDVPLAALRVVAGDTSVAPNEGVTAGSLSIEHGGAAIRVASAMVRTLFVEAAAARLGCSTDEVTLSDGRFVGPGGNDGPGYGDLAVDVDLDSWERHIAINLTGTFYGCRAAIPALAASGEAATIVNVGSMLAQRAAGGMAAYCASKAGVTHLTKSVALDLAERGLNIRANTVHPGAIRTPMYGRYLNAGGATPEEIDAAMVSAHPMGRVGEPEEVAKAILFLSCEDSSFTSGTDLNVDGASAIRS